MFIAPSNGMLGWCDNRSARSQDQPVGLSVPRHDLSGHPISADDRSLKGAGSFIASTEKGDADHMRITFARHRVRAAAERRTAETSSYAVRYGAVGVVLDERNIAYYDESPESDDVRARLGRSDQKFVESELKRKGVGYHELAEKLSALGIPESERNLANKIARGGFTATFLVQCLTEIEVNTLRLDTQK